MSVSHLELRAAAAGPWQHGGSEGKHTVERLSDQRSPGLEGDTRQSLGMKDDTRLSMFGLCLCPIDGRTVPCNNKTGEYYSRQYPSSQIVTPLFPVASHLPLFTVHGSTDTSIHQQQVRGNSPDVSLPSTVFSAPHPPRWRPISTETNRPGRPYSCCIPPQDTSGDPLVPLEIHKEHIEWMTPPDILINCWVQGEEWTNERVRWWNVKWWQHRIRSGVMTSHYVM